MLGGYLDGRLLTVMVVGAVTLGPLEGFTTSMAQYDATILKLVLVMFVVISIIGTRMVVRCGELPANDELFSMPEQLTPVQQTALRAIAGRAGAQNAAAAG